MSNSSLSHNFDCWRNSKKTKNKEQRYCIVPKFKRVRFGKHKMSNHQSSLIKESKSEVMKAFFDLGFFQVYVNMKLF